MLKPVSVQKVSAILRKALPNSGYKVWRTGDMVHVWYGHALPAAREKRRDDAGAALSARCVEFHRNPNGDTLICTGIKEAG